MIKAEKRIESTFVVLKATADNAAKCIAEYQGKESNKERRK